MKEEFIVALAGNPNCGKTTLFNALTGSRQHVGNWPGVTVEKKEGMLEHGGLQFTVVDLPGIYSLGAYSEDEVVARDFILKSNPDVIVNVVDATNLERNLYLTTQLMEVHANVIIALNMMDEADYKKIEIDVEKLSKAIGIPIIPVTATKKKGFGELLESIHGYTKNKKVKRLSLDYGQSIREEVAAIKLILAQDTVGIRYPLDWAALKLLENDKHVLKLIEDKFYYVDIAKRLEEKNAEIEEETGFDLETLIVEKRYGFIAGVIQGAIEKEEFSGMTVSDKVDRIITHRWFGIPIFALIMFLVYQITMKFGNDFLGGKIEDLFSVLGQWVSAALANTELSPLMTSLIIDGIIGGLGSVLVFTPLIFVLYLLISILEDSGYMARAAYVMDRFMTSIGLHGKTSISMIIGSGCNVAGIMATRTLESKKDRMIAILINPFISCGARLPVYALFAGAFFAERKIGIFSASGIVIFSLYILGIVVAILAGKVLSKTMFKGESSYFIMEFPPYRIPSVKTVLLHMWEKGEAFLKKAGTIIFSIIIIVWFLSNLPFGVEPSSQASFLGRLGSVIAPIFKPAGFGSWQAAVSLLTGILAKESVIGTLGTVYGVGDEGLTAAIQQTFTPLSAYAFMVMTLLYIPCAATIGAIRRETNSRKLTIFSVIYTLIIGWIGAVLVFQIGKLLGLQ